MATKVKITLDGNGTPGDLEAKILKYAREVCAYPSGETMKPIAWIMTKKVLSDIIDYCDQDDTCSVLETRKANREAYKNQVTLTVVEETI